MTFQVWVEMDSDQPTGWLLLCVYKITSIIVNMKTKRAYKYRFYPTSEQGWTSISECESYRIYQQLAHI